ncbi:hypothetical protein EDC94DRAFT_635453 [Helicostylum pulchrum]|nr:hypothetical protein EDC94DRAFT_635453 [Helicostylum pulchrum]
MAVGKLNVTPVTVRGVPTSNDARLFVGCYVQETEKHRTHTESGSEPSWKNCLSCNVTEGNNFLHVELVNENPSNGGIIATTKVPLNSVYQQGTESKWVQLHSSSGQAMGEVKLDLSFSGTNSVSSVSSSFGGMNLTGGEHVSYSQTTTHSQTTAHGQSDSRSSSYSSLGPANPIPSNYGSGNPPPFTPQAAVSYPEKSGGMPGSGMPGSGMPGAGMPAGGLVGGKKIENLDKNEFEEAKEKGAIPSWMKYGGGVLAGAAAIGLTAWGAHELKDRYDDKNEEEERLNQQQQQQKPSQPQGNSPYKIENQQGQQQGQQQQQQQQQTQHKAQEQTHYPTPPQQQQHFSAEKKEDKKCEKKSEKKHDDKKSEKKEHKKEKKDKKDKKHKKNGSDSSSSDSDSDSSDDERKGKKDKHHKKRDSDWK